jgi:uncharacterized membrane-anchored protein
MNKTSSYSTRRTLISKHIHPKLKRSLRLYLILSLVLLIFVIISAIRSDANPLVILAALLIGIVIGILFGRIYKISWDKDAEKVIKRMDIFGIVLLVLFVTLRLFIVKDHVIGIFVTAGSVGATSLALLAGTLYGRVFSIGRFILQVFREQEILPQRKK